MKYSRNADNGPREREINFGDFPDPGRTVTVTFDLPYGYF